MYVKQSTAQKWFAGELAPYVWSNYYIKKTEEVDTTGIVRGEFLRKRADGSIITMAKFEFSRVDGTLETKSLFMRENSKLSENFDENLLKMMNELYPVRVILSPKANKKTSEPLGVDDIKNAAFLMFESLKNAVLLDEHNLTVRVIHETDKENGTVTMPNFNFAEFKNVVPWTQALDLISRYKQVDSDTLEEFFLRRLPEE